MRTTPPSWGMPLYSGDMWAACTAQTADYSATWEQLDPDETWADQPPDAIWAEDLFAVPAPIPVLGGILARDWYGVAARTRATVIMPTGPSSDPVQQGTWIRLHGHLTPAADAPPDGDPALVPAVEMAVLYVVGRERDRVTGELTIAADDLVALLGTRQLDSGDGPTGYLPTARTAVGVIIELVDTFAPIEATVHPGDIADQPWTPALDPDTSQPVPLTGSVWAAIEDMCSLAGAVIAADGPWLRLASTQWGAAHTGITITETPTLDGVQATESTRHEAPAITRVIATGKSAAGDPIAGRAHDPDTALAQGYDIDEEVNIPGASTPPALTVAAIARLAYQQSRRHGGRVAIPWLPMLDAGDLLTVAWDDAGAVPYYLDSVAIPLDPTSPVQLELRGPALARWQDEPPDATWAQLDPALTWAEDI